MPRPPDDILPVHRLDITEPFPGVDYWATGCGDGNIVKLQINRLELLLAIGATPSPQTEVSRHIRAVAVQLGVSTGKALAYSDIGTMFARCPEIGRALSCGAFSFDHMRVLADAVGPVADEHITAVDRAIYRLLTPVRPRQVVPGVYVLRRQVAEIIAEIAPEARPSEPDGDGELPPPQAQLDFQVDDRDLTTTGLHITVPSDEGLGAVRIIDAVAEKLDCSRATAFIELLHGRAHAAGAVTVTLNCYRNLDTATMHLENTWLSGTATECWMARVTELCVAGHSEVDGYTNTTHQRATIAGRDGACRGPGCDKAAATAQIDHVARFDTDDPSARGKTATWAEHSLCPACHALKTRGIWDVTLNPDGTDHWTSIDDGHTVVDVPTGPLAQAVMTFDKRLHRKVRTLAEHNGKRLAHIAELEEVFATERPF